MARRWKDLLLSLGESLAEVLGAEVEALKSDLRISSSKLGTVVALGATALFLLFWSVGALGFVLFHIAVVWLPGWGAALVVLGLFLLVALILVGLTRRRWLAIEAPGETIRRHYEDHVSWWEGQLPGGDEEGAELRLAAPVAGEDETDRLDR